MAHENRDIERWANLQETLGRRVTPDDFAAARVEESVPEPAPEPEPEPAPEPKRRGRPPKVTT